MGGGKLPGASRIDRADWAVLKKDGQMEALCKHRRLDGGQLLGMCHSSERKKRSRRPKYKTLRSNLFPKPPPHCPSPQITRAEALDVLYLGPEWRHDARRREEGSPSTHPPSCYNESCLSGRSETATHIQSVCACDGGLANSKVSPPRTLAQTKKREEEDAQSAHTNESLRLHLGP